MKVDDKSKGEAICSAILLMATVEVCRWLLKKGLDAADRRWSTNNKKTGDVS